MRKASLPQSTTLLLDKRQNECHACSCTRASCKSMLLEQLSLLDLRVLFDELADLGSNEEVHYILECFLQIEGPAVIPELFFYLNEAIELMHIEPSL
jgi:hypothetical protein